MILRDIPRRRTDVGNFSNNEGESNENTEFRNQARNMNVSGAGDGTRPESSSMVVGERGDVTVGVRSDMSQNEARNNTGLQQIDGTGIQTSLQIFLHPEDVRSLIPEFVPGKITVEK